MVTTIARSSETSNLLPLPTYDKVTLAQLQQDYGLSCSKYEELAEKRLAKTDTIILSGIGSALRVKNNALMIFPGKTHNAQKQETTMLYRGIHGIIRIILLTDKGLITLDAIKWCEEQEISILMLDSRGNVIQTLCCEAISNSALRRKQYASDVSGKVSYELVRRKIIAQLDTLKTHPELPDRDNAIAVLTSAVLPP
jgi:CRISPR/Cas system-associated endonuclease Cas1